MTGRWYLCADGEGIDPITRECVICPTGQTILDSKECGYCPDGQGIDSTTGKCIICPSGQGILPYKFQKKKELILMVYAKNVHMVKVLILKH